VKIVIFGSTVMTAKVCRLLKEEHDIVGYIPSVKPNFPGDMSEFKRIQQLPEDYDIKLSIQFDRKIKKLENAFNLHTGILGDWGGCDILYHTLKSGHHEQGLTFHGLTSEYDYGPIISKVTYPVFTDDTPVTLYERMLNITPGFCTTALRTLENIGLDRVSECHQVKPRIFKRKVDIDPEGLEEYKQTYYRIYERLKLLGEINE
jgi:methionyl-tRNA formyltransferase